MMTQVSYVRHQEGDVLTVYILASFYKYGLTWIPTWIQSNQMTNKVWGDITNPFPNVNGCTIEVWEWINNLITYFIMEAIT